MTGEPTFFAAPDDWRRWLEKHHAKRTEILVGFYKKGSGKPSITWPESVDAALCFGWIDGVRRRIDEFSYSIRFTPRKPASHWSAVNINRVGELLAGKLMHPAGIRAFEARDEKRSRRASYEQESVAFDSEMERQFKANRAAWKFFQAQPPSYRKLVTWRVIRAIREETRQKKLAALIEASEGERRLL